LDCDVDLVQRGEQRFKRAMHRSLVGRRNGLRDSLIFLPIYHLACGVAQIRPGTQIYLWIVVHRQPLD
jgi:hypothetical protein